MGITGYLKQPFFRNLLLLAVVLRLLIMPFYFHPDIKTTNYKVSFLKEGVIDIYSHIEQNLSKLTYPEQFNYFPVTYFFLGSYQVLASPFLGEDFSDWLTDAGQSANERVGAYRYLLILKLPYLMFDIFTAFLLMGFFTLTEQKRRVFTLWLFNPLSIILIYVFSNIDIIPVFLTVVSLYYFEKNKLFAAAVMLGLGASFKAFPLLLVPFLILKAPTVKEKIVVSLASFGTFFITILPVIFNSSFHQSALASGLTTRIVYTGIGLGFSENLLVTVFMYTLLIFIAYLSRGIDLLIYTLLTFLFILSSIHFHIQWVLWVMPFVTLVTFSVREEKKVINILWLFIISASVIPLLYQDRYMSTMLLNAISPLFVQLPTPATAVQRIYDPYVIQSVLHTVLLSVSIATAFKLLKQRMP